MYLVERKPSSAFRNSEKSSEGIAVEPPERTPVGVGKRKPVEIISLLMLMGKP